MENNQEESLNIPTEASFDEDCKNMENYIRGLHGYPDQSEFEKMFFKNFFEKLRIIGEECAK